MGLPTSCINARSLANTAAGRYARARTLRTLNRCRRGGFSSIRRASRPFRPQKMKSLIRLALDRPYTFVVLGILILLIGPLAALRTPVDIFPAIKLSRAAPELRGRRCSITCSPGIGTPASGSIHFL